MDTYLLIGVACTVIIGFWMAYDLLIARIDTLEYQVRELQAVVNASQAVMEALVDLTKEQHE